MDGKNDRFVLHQMVASQGPNQGLALILYFVFKICLVIASAISIWLGYRLFVLGVTGKDSLNVDAKGIGGQLLNAAPGLFFAIGGIAALIVIAWKGVKLKV